MSEKRTLPDFSAPPLTEVVIGVQFESLASYTSINAKEVWELYKTEYPRVEEHPPLAPQFELISGGAQGLPFKFSFGGAFTTNRLWFVSPDESRLLQFQNDRLLMNWRKSQNPTEYPRFEKLSDSFNEHFVSLQKFVRKAFDQELRINQAEISYVNQIEVDEFGNSSKWLKCVDDGQLNIESLNTNFTEILFDKNKLPNGRFFCACQSALKPDRLSKIIQFSLTCRGKPNGESIEDAANFLVSGRAHIVNKFAELTTDEAHKYWRRNQ